jgi:putative ABC transport system permease protein
MIKNYFLVAFRNLVKNKAFSLINIVGLAVGMAACLLIIQYVVFELSYDSFLPNKGQVYRVNQDRYNNNKLSTQWAAGAFAAGSAFKAAFPEVEDMVKVTNTDLKQISYQEKIITAEKAYFAGSSFFNVLGFPMINGDANTALKEPFSVVITQTTAQKLFGRSNPIGATITLNKDKPYKVTGVMKDFPSNTHFKTDILISYATFLVFVGPKNDIDHAWYNDGCLTYLKLKPGTDVKALEAKFIPISKKAYADVPGEKAVYTLQPVQDIHLYSHRMMEAEPNADGNSVYLLLGIAIFVIIIAWINYINLATARGLGRAKEVGVRKTLGSAKGQLIGQFMLESVVLNGLAVVLAIIIIAICLPAFSALSGQQLSFTLLLSPVFWLAILGIFLVGSFCSGFYPAIVLSNFKPVEVMKGKLTASPKGIVLRKGMVIFQFAASIFLLIGSLTVFKQIKYMQQQQLGINISQTLVIKPPLGKIDSLMRDMNLFKQQSLAQSTIKSITISTSVPGQPVRWNAGGIRLHGANEIESKQYRVIGADADFLTAYDIKLLAGRKFAKSYVNDPHNVVFNRSAAKQMGFDDPQQALNKQIDFWGEVYTIVGVVDDYHQESLRDAYDAIIFRCIPDVNGFISIKLNPENLAQTLTMLKANWKNTFPGEEFNYFFMDQHFNEQYQADQRFGQVFGVFTFIAILVACLGLFGLVSFTIVQRTKEIGIRKVLGASVNSILQLLYKDFALLVIVSFFVSAPIAWYATNKWLSGYAFRIQINWTLFVLPFLTVLVIALLTVSFLSVKAALTNPVKSLKTE